MPNQDFTPEQKAQIALESLIGEITEATTSKDVGEKYNISTRQVNAWKQQGLNGFKNSFIEEEEEKSIDPNLLSNKIAGLLRNTASVATNASAKPSESFPIEDVVSKIIKWNDEGSEPKIYLSESIVSKICGHSNTDVRKYFKQHSDRIKQHNQKHELDSSTNKGLRRFDYKNKLEL